MTLGSDCISRLIKRLKHKCFISYPKEHLKIRSKTTYEYVITDNMRLLTYTYKLKYFSSNKNQCLC